jgi:3-oxoacyl-[acyl-carrier protein] reductase
MDLGLSGKRALVTGGSSGIGAGIAALLAEEGVSVAVHGRDIERTERIAADLRLLGRKAQSFVGDIATDRGASAVAQAVLREMGGVDILVNVVGGPGEGLLTWENTTPQLWADQFELNTLSAVRMVQHLLPGMKLSGWGRIIQIASIAGLRPLPNLTPAYAAAKAALITMSLSLAMTVAGSGVTVNSISPGFIATDALKRFVLDSADNKGKRWEDVEQAAAQAFRVSIGRFGRPKDIAAATAFLASPLAEWITGSHFRIDGGTCDWVG